MKFLFRMGMFLCLTTLVVSCGGGSGSSGSTTVNYREDIGLDGSWLSNCYYDSEFDEYYLDLLIFSGSEVTLDSDVWDNDTCTGTPVESIYVEGTYTVGDLITTSGGTDAYEIDFVFPYMGETITLLDIVEVHEGEFYLGEYITDVVRPVAIDYSIVYTKQ